MTQFNFNSDGFWGVAIVLISIFWVLPWKGIALWKAAKNGSKKWFIAILILNTLAILEIVYIFFFSKKKKDEFIAESQE